MRLVLVFTISFAGFVYFQYIISHPVAHWEKRVRKNPLKLTAENKTDLLASVLKITGIIDSERKGETP